MPLLRGNVGALDGDESSHATRCWGVFYGTPLHLYSPCMILTHSLRDTVHQSHDTLSPLPANEIRLLWLPSGQFIYRRHQITLTYTQQLLGITCTVICWCNVYSYVIVTCTVICWCNMYSYMMVYMWLHVSVTCTVISWCTCSVMYSCNMYIDMLVYMYTHRFV